LGFAFYMEGELSLATEAWLGAIDLADGRQSQDPMPSSATGAADVLDSGTQETNPDILTAYAGFALALVRMAETQPWEEQQTSLSKAAKIYQLVMTNDPKLMESNGQTQNWLWTEKILEDWAALPEAVSL